MSANSPDYRTPYDVCESIHGEYNPDVVPVVIFSNWMRAEKAAYLIEHPEAARNQIDGNFYDPELGRFFRWISERER
jgi:hypothetical protein